MGFDASHPEVRDAIARALAEDIGRGDITSELTVPAEIPARGSFVAKQDMVIAGIELLRLVYEVRGRAVVQTLTASGDAVQSGAVLARVEGPARTLLECERVALNFLQRLSGIATLARKYVNAVAGTKARVLDTRKTTPGLRTLEKMAAAAGGATNHRRGLFDAVLIKNNHITAAGGVRAALETTRSYSGLVDIVVRTRDVLDAALTAGAKLLLLDNLSPPLAADWIRHIDGRATVELSGGITLDSIRDYAEAGPDFISVGAITHSATAVDISFRLELDAA
jgi:nicotinate-nucleotide pyrophosphorylase (carboxylating)